MEKLFSLLELQAQARAADTRQSLLHVIVNETRKIIPYEHACSWEWQGTQILFGKVSGNGGFDEKGAYATSLCEKIAQELEKKSSSDFIAVRGEGDGGAVSFEGALMIFRTAQEGLIGGVWFEKAGSYNDAEIRLGEEIAAIYAHLLALWQRREGTNGIGLRGLWRNARKFLTLALVIAFFFPVRHAITAPAEIVARSAQVATAPFDGIVGTVHVTPGDPVKAGDVLFSMRQDDLDARMDMAKQELSVAKDMLSRLERESLAAPEKRGGIARVRQEIGTREIEYDYALSLRERSEVRAARDGVAVFADASGLAGKPVRAGDKIMTVAGEGDTELLIRIPADSLIPFDKSADTYFYPSLMPLSRKGASIKSIGYQASADPDGLLTYKVTAALPENSASLRIGWKGTAKIYGGWTIFSYAVMRKPLLMLRTFLGV